MSKQTLTLKKENLNADAVRKNFVDVELSDFTIPQNIIASHDTIIFTDGQRDRILKQRNPEE